VAERRLPSRAVTLAKKASFPGLYLMFTRSGVRVEPGERPEVVVEPDAKPPSGRGGRRTRTRSSGARERALDDAAPLHSPTRHRQRAGVVVPDRRRKRVSLAARSMLGRPETEIRKRPALAVLAAVAGPVRPLARKGLLDMRIFSRIPFERNPGRGSLVSVESNSCFRPEKPRRAIRARRGCRNASQ
jgi:hypothetical protein